MTNSYALAAAVLGAALSIVPAGHAQSRTHRNLNINMQGDAESCADLKVSSSGELAQTAEKFSLQRSEVPTLELNAADKGAIKVKGWTQNTYSVDVCKIAVAEDKGTAERTLSGINVSRSAGRFSFTGPQGDDANWQVYFIVHTPANASIDLEGRNAPISVADVNGVIKARDGNGPVAIKNCTGTVDAQTKNGPIAFAGDSGEVHLQADNGPISVRVSKEIWNGSLLDAHTSNGPMSLVLPSAFRSGVRVEASRSAPMSCKHEACAAAFRDNGTGKQTLQMNGSSETIRVTTGSGPISVGSEKKSEKIL